MMRFASKKYLILLTGFSMMLLSQTAFCDDGAVEAADAADQKTEEARAHGQFPHTEMAPAIAPASVVAPEPATYLAPMPEDPMSVDPEAVRAQEAAANRTKEAVSGNYPKGKSTEDEILAKRFSWWPTDAKPAPVKDEYRSGYWWWPEIPGEERPWGNQGWVYVRKIIFDYKSSEGNLKPSLIIKRVIKNVKVLFDYDKSDLRNDAEDILDKALYTLDKNPKADILITGNADRRGSEQYNQKLGENRASAVERYLLDKGLSEDRIRILSRGKLDAMAPTHDLVGMQKDRNAQFMIAEVEEVMIPAEKAHLFQDKVIEEKEEVESAVKVGTKDYVIQSGDSLWKIAEREYGNGRQWKRIYEFNKDVISNPDRPKKGTRIKIPIE
jgi:outer membrane protein OmpA-like peptidoglycan-associated protein